MSFSPSLSLVRLQELKLWQGSYDNILQKSKSLDADEQDCKENVSLNGSGLEKYPKEWDKRKISPSKPFEQLLEEKLAEDTPVEVNSKPKRPFLRKGEGLARFKMGAARPVRRIVNSGPKKQAPQKSTPAVVNKTPPSKRRGILKKINPLFHKDIDLSPLTVPDFVKPRGTWKQVLENEEKNIDDQKCEETEEKFEEANYRSLDQDVKNVFTSRGIEDFRVEQDTLENYEEFRKSLGEDDKVSMFKSSSGARDLDKYETPKSVNCAESKSIYNNLTKDMIQNLNQYAQKFFQRPTDFFSNDIPDSVAGLEHPKIPKAAGDLTLDELKMEKELRIFEALEKRADNSSFCSTNTSVVNLLAVASTPQKSGDQLMDKGKIILEEEGEDQSIEDSIFPKSMHDIIEKKIHEVSEKTDILQQFLMNLRGMDPNNKQNGDYTVDSDRTNMQKTISTNTSFSEEHTRWSTRSPSLLSSSTDYSETTCHSDTLKRTDAGVNTSFDRLDETLQTASESCKECQELGLKFSDLKLKMSDLKAENSKLSSELRDVRKESDKLKKTVKREAEKYQEKIDTLVEELDSERKKIAREKAYFETYVKESQNRTSKKDREEISQLKQAVADAKELLKLKDTKTGATQARLRTQIKQQEKEITELKNTVEKLQKENAKLTANQKFARRPQEVKMLHEINKNLSKLAEETFKKQLNKTGSGDVEIKEEKKSEKVTEDETNGDKENEKVANKNKEIKRTKTQKDSTCLDVTPQEGLTIVQQYESMFGQFSSPRNANASTSIEKSERALADGSVEIIYSNGNLKTVSADGKFIRMKYFNGDTKETDLRQQIIKYHYAVADSWHIQHPDGTEVMEFKDGQKCTKYTDGKTEVSYPDGSLRIINVDGTEEQTFPDGRKTIKNLQGEQIILLPNGQREVHTQEYKRREYPDGTVRTLHKDGTVETVYANGRVRLKDSNGVLIMDTHQT